MKLNKIYTFVLMMLFAAIGTSQEGLSIYSDYLTDNGIGAIVYNDKNGFSSQTGGYATYAHHLMFSRSEADLNQLSLGLSAGFIQYRLDQSSFATNDPLVDAASLSSAQFNMDVGLSYNLLDFYTHVTVKNMNPLFYTHIEMV